MASSRIFVKGLPPTFTEADFKKHFSQGREVTDAKIFPNRRIGYVGYRTPEEAQKAVKYFNKTFIRMSRIEVELARPPAEKVIQSEGRGAPTARRESSGEEKKLVKKDDAGKDEHVQQDPKLKEFLEVMRPKSKKRAWEDDVPKATDDGQADAGTEGVAVVDAHSDSEYEDVPRPTKKVKKDTKSVELVEAVSQDQTEPTIVPTPDKKDDDQQDADDGKNDTLQGPVSDADWARSRTSRLLGLLDDDEDAPKQAERSPEDLESADDSEAEGSPQVKATAVKATAASMPTPPDENEDETSKSALPADVEAVRSSMRLFVRNLPYNVKEEDLEAEFKPFGTLDEVHVPMDTKSGNAKGFAYIQFTDADAAEQAMVQKDGRTFQGRLLHVLPASKKRETQLDDFELAKLPLKKQQQIRKRREAANTTFNWNALYMNADAVVSSVASKLGVSKSEILDPTSSDAAIKQALAETHVIQETKTYFREHGVDLDAFKRSSRGDTGILIKNIPYDCSRDELKRLFEEHGELKRFLMPSSQTLAVVEFANAAQCKAAFGALAYRKLKGSVLFLEKAPKGLFDGKIEKSKEDDSIQGVAKTSAADLRDAENTFNTTGPTATVFVRNLNFSTTNDDLSRAFKSLDGFLSARVKTKVDPKKPGQTLSMGFGFLEFRTAEQAQAAIGTMDNYTLDGHKLQLRASHKGADAAETRRRADAKKRSAGRKTKVVIKNLPFEATKKDVRALFGAYGTLRSVRVPKKMDRAARGFAFADFTTPKEADNALEALRDTHLLGRRLVLDFAEEEAEDPEVVIKRMQEKVGGQVNRVALQGAVAGGKRKKFRVDGEEEG